MAGFVLLPKSQPNFFLRWSVTRKSSHQAIRPLFLSNNKKKQSEGVTQFFRQIKKGMFSIVNLSISQPPLSTSLPNFLPNLPSSECMSLVKDIFYLFQ